MLPAWPHCLCIWKLLYVSPLNPRGLALQLLWIHKVGETEGTSFGFFAITHLPSDWSLTKPDTQALGPYLTHSGA